MQAEALTEIGKLQHKKRDYRKAAEQLQKAVDLRPNGLQVGTGYILLPCLYMRHGQNMLPNGSMLQGACNTGS